MTFPQIFHGSWEQIERQASGLHHRDNLTLIVPAEEQQAEIIYPLPLPRHFYMEASPEDFQKAFDALGDPHKNAPILSDAAFDRENLYDEERA